MKDTLENTKRVIIVIVEGISDQVSFENYLNAIAKNKNVFFCVYKGDLLTDYKQDDKSVNDIIKSLVNQCISIENFSIDDVDLVIQLIDTDGAFANNVVLYDPLTNSDYSVMYFEDKILTRNVLKFSKTQAYKKERINDCLALKNIEMNLEKKIPYEIYYMSCNLECALYGKYNTLDEEKVDL